MWYPRIYDALTNAMQKPYHVLYSVGGMIQSAECELPYLGTGFDGGDFPHWGIESMAGINKLLSHFGLQLLIGVQYQMFEELLITEVGILAQPFLLDYTRYGCLATPCILKETLARTQRVLFPPGDSCNEMHSTERG